MVETAQRPPYSTIGASLFLLILMTPVVVFTSRFYLGIISSVSRVTHVKLPRKSLSMTVEGEMLFVVGGFDELCMALLLQEA